MEEVNNDAVKYLNRLSDWFFVAGRIANNDGKDDVLWVPGLTRCLTRGSALPLNTRRLVALSCRICTVVCGRESVLAHARA
jgi:hypothetical protein